MPVQLASFTKAVDPDVVRALKDLTTAVNLLEPHIAKATTAPTPHDLAAVQSLLTETIRRVDDLTRRVAALE